MFEWENRLAVDLDLLMGSTRPILDAQDGWSWKPGPAVGFSVKQAYLWLKSHNDALLTNRHADSKVFRYMWKMAIPSKVRMCVWRLFLDSLPTKLALFHRGILPDGSALGCTFCLMEEESASHLLFNCSRSSAIWYGIFNWMGISTALHLVPKENFIQFGFIFEGMIGKKFKYIIWGATVWVLWLNRNKILFQDGIFDQKAIMAHIKFTTWSWIVFRKGVKVSMAFDDWIADPFGCLIPK